MISVAELMLDPDFVRTFTVRRARGAFADEGVYSSTYQNMTIVGIVQPASPRELLMLPEGSRLKDVIAVWSNLEMRVADGDKLESDIVVVDGKTYRVIKCEPWPQAGFFKVLAEGYVR